MNEQDQKMWVDAEVAAIGQNSLDRLVAAAREVRKNAYAPYSHYLVGAALLSHSGAVYAGCNSEVASFSETTHAEQHAITKAVSEGEVHKSGRRFIRAIAVVHASDTAPCGHCRQIIMEHADNAVVLWADPAGKIFKITSLKLLLPHAFSPTDLGIS